VTAQRVLACTHCSGHFLGAKLQFYYEAYLQVQACSGVETALLHLVWMWEQRSHTFFTVTSLEDAYFYSDFVCVAPDIA